MLKSRSRLALLFLPLISMGLGAVEIPESVRWLQEYLRIDTTNPPGNEREAAEYLAEILEREGIESRLLTSPAGRTSLYARWESSGGDGQSVVLLHHMDVVPAGGQWQEEPFSGRYRHGKVWGRGAIDAKGLGVAQLAALVALKREGRRLARDVVFLAVADEELGGRNGSGWLVQAHPELLEGVSVVLNEGGANRTIGDRLVFWGLEVAQKRPLWLRVQVRGQGGHGAAFAPESPTHQLVLALARLIELPLTYRVSEPARRYLGALSALEQGKSLEAFRQLDALIEGENPGGRLPAGWPAVLVDTVQVTEIENGKGPNVIAPVASAYVDVRLLPDTDADAFLVRIKQALGEGVEVEVILSAPEVDPSASEGPMWRALEKVLAVRGPVVPMMISGTTDSRYFRARGIPTYGFSPFSTNAEETRGIHAPDESIPMEDFLRGVETMRRVLLACAGE